MVGVLQTVFVPLPLWALKRVSEATAQHLVGSAVHRPSYCLYRFPMSGFLMVNTILTDGLKPTCQTYLRANANPIDCNEFQT